MFPQILLYWPVSSDLTSIRRSGVVELGLLSSLSVHSTPSSKDETWSVSSNWLMSLSLLVEFSLLVIFC